MSAPPPRPLPDAREVQAKLRLIVRQHGPLAVPSQSWEHLVTQIKVTGSPGTLLLRFSVGSWGVSRPMSGKEDLDEIAYAIRGMLRAGFWR